MSEAKSTPTIFEVFAAAKREVRAVGKDRRNQQQNFNFRGIDDVVNAAAPALDKHGVITAPVLDEIQYATVEVGQKRTPMAHVRVKVTYRFHGPAGDHFDATVPGEAMDSGDKATAKAMSVAYRIALIQALNLPTTEQDPDAQTYERSPRESLENATHAHARAQGTNGDGDGRVTRPSRPARPAPEAFPDEIDEEAQELANEAHEARTIRDLKVIHARASGQGKLGSFVADPATGIKGALAPYLNFRKRQLEEVDAALTALHDAAQAQHLTIADLEEHVKKVTGGAGIEAAAAAQLREAATALSGGAA